MNNLHLWYIFPSSTRKRTRDVMLETGACPLRSTCNPSSLTRERASGGRWGERGRKKRKQEPRIGFGVEIEGEWIQCESLKSERNRNQQQNKSEGSSQDRELRAQETVSWGESLLVEANPSSDIDEEVREQVEEKGAWVSWCVASAQCVAQRKRAWSTMSSNRGAQAIQPGRVAADR